MRGAAASLVEHALVDDLVDNVDQVAADVPQRDEEAQPLESAVGLVAVDAPIRLHLHIDLVRRVGAAQDLRQEHGSAWRQEPWLCVAARARQ